MTLWKQRRKIVLCHTSEMSANHSRPTHEFRQTPCLAPSYHRVPEMILVTGGAGFIGSNITAALAERGTPVAVCDRFRNASKWRNLSKLELRDVVAPEALTAWLDAHAERVEAIVHMGAISSTTESDVDLIMEVNFRLSRMLWS